MNEIERYIKQFPDKVQEILHNIRKLILDVAPDSDEHISYGMPAYKTNGKPLVYFAAFKKHIGFYATPSGHKEFQKELSKYKQGKGSVQFSLDQPIPYNLIERIVEFRLIENNEKTKLSNVKRVTQITNLNSEVSTFLDEQNHPFRLEIEQLRNCILSANPALTENIKWNGPNYCFDNKDRITMRIQPPKKQAQLIFHRGAKKQTQPKDKLILNESKMLLWKENDRAIVTFNSLQDIESGKTELTKIINEWLEATK